MGSIQDKRDVEGGVPGVEAASFRLSGGALTRVDGAKAVRSACSPPPVPTSGARDKIERRSLHSYSRVR